VLNSNYLQGTVLIFDLRSLKIVLNTLPEDAVLVFRDVQAKHNVTMHFMTFPGSEHEVYQLCIANLLKLDEYEYRSMAITQFAYLRGVCGILYFIRNHL
jgi:hypothetical protein